MLHGSCAQALFGLAGFQALVAMSLPQALLVPQCPWSIDAGQARPIGGDNVI